ncbi:MAG: ACT domain-containing protein [Methanoregulaceae archaeon]|nr:ACT domain-containing protein [Methanoregulaceae archaeon]
MRFLALGPEGTFSEEVARRLNGDDVILLPTIHRICAEVEKGGGIGVIPLENSEAGGVGASLDCLQSMAITITGETYMKIHHHLAAFVPLENVDVVYAHPQAHEQCSIVIEELGKEVVHTGSNAQSAVEVTKHRSSAAIVPEMTAHRYGIPVIRSFIENSPDNTTRFVLVSALPGQASGDKCSVLIDPEVNRSGLLYDLLGVFSKRGINLTRIESRPSKRGIGTYVFFIDLECTGDWEAAIAELSSLTKVKNLGMYSRIEVPEWRS